MGKISVEPVHVLDEYGSVELIDYMGEEDAVVDAARVSFAKQASNYTPEENLRLLRYLIKHNHESPFEMVTFKFRIKAPVIVWWHWVRHRIASYNFASGRYIPFREDECYRPTEWRMQSSSNKQGSDPTKKLDPGLSDLFSDRRDSLYEQCYELYEDMLEAGIAKEQARLVLPFAAVHYEAIWQVNCRSLTNFLVLRMGEDAQQEIRDYANAMCNLVRTSHPNLFTSLPTTQ